MKLKFEEVCLVNALRSHIFRAPCIADGPFWVFHDGNRMLQPFKKLGCEVESKSALLLLSQWSVLLLFRSSARHPFRCPWTSLNKKVVSLLQLAASLQL